MEKRAIVLILFIILLFGGLGGGFYYLYEKGYFKQEPKIIIKEKTFFIKPIDINTQEAISLDYKLFEGQKIEECLTKTSFKIYQQNQTLFYENFPALKNKVINEKGCYIKEILFTQDKEGLMTPNLNEFVINEEKLYLFYFFSENYYVDKQFWMPLNINTNEIKEYLTTPRDKVILMKDIIPKSVLNVEATKKENNLTINLWGEVSSNSTNNLRLNLKGENELRDVIVCFKWTLGIVDLISDWEININSIRYTFSDRCYKLNENLDKNNNYEISKDFQLITSEFLEGWDEFLEIVVIDNEYYYDGDKWIYDFEDGNKDVGAKDFFKKCVYNITDLGKKCN